MAGFQSATAAFTLKKALFDVATELWREDKPEFEVVWGRIARWPDQYVQFSDMTFDQEPATVSPNRSREETVRVSLNWFVFRGGQVGAAIEAEEYLFSRVGELERHIRYSDPTVGGVARHCFLTEGGIDTAEGTRANHKGHLAAALTTFEGKIRITG